MDGGNSKYRNCQFNPVGNDEDKNVRHDEHLRNKQRFIYDLPYPEETGHWIPVSIPPKGSIQYDGPETGSMYGETFPDSLMNSPAGSLPPEVNLRNVLRGFLAVLSRRPESLNCKFRSSISDSASLNEAFSPTRLRSSTSYFHGPGAPPLQLDVTDCDGRAIRATLEAEPPDWMPDSSAHSCTQCGAVFRALTCGRHHCRFCGEIFCRSCSANRSLLPEKFRERDPKRVCKCCWERLEPLQSILADRVSNAAQTALHDVTDLSSMRAWVNSPFGLSMEHEIFKATNALRAYYKIGISQPEGFIPDAVLQGAQGVAILSIVKAGVMVTYKLGTGLVVSRRMDGTWSAPSAIASCGLGWGVQAGGELTDFIIVLRTQDAVKAFSGKVHLSVGAGLSVAAGPVGRAAEVDVRAGDGGAAACYTYSQSKGAFIGCSLEGNIVATRASANNVFYGNPCVTSIDILLGTVPRPRAGAPLYSALSDLFSRVDT